MSSKKKKSVKLATAAVAIPALDLSQEGRTSPSSSSPPASHYALPKRTKSASPHFSRSAVDKGSVSPRRQKTARAGIPSSSSSPSAALSSSPPTSAQLPSTPPVPVSPRARFQRSISPRRLQLGDGPPPRSASAACEWDQYVNTWILPESLTSEFEPALAESISEMYTVGRDACGTTSYDHGALSEHAPESRSQMAVSAPAPALQLPTAAADPVSHIRRRMEVSPEMRRRRRLTGEASALARTLAMLQEEGVAAMESDVELTSPAVNPSEYQADQDSSGSEEEFEDDVWRSTTPPIADVPMDVLERSLSPRSQRHDDEHGDDDVGPRDADEHRVADNEMERRRKRVGIEVSSFSATRPRRKKAHATRSHDDLAEDVHRGPPATPTASDGVRGRGSTPSLSVSSGTANTHVTASFVPKPSFGPHTTLPKTKRTGVSLPRYQLNLIHQDFAWVSWEGNAFVPPAPPSPSVYELGGHAWLGPEGELEEPVQKERKKKRKKKDHKERKKHRGSKELSEAEESGSEDAAPFTASASSAARPSSPLAQEEQSPPLSSSSSSLSSSAPSASAIPVLVLDLDEEALLAQGDEHHFGMSPAPLGGGASRPLHQHVPSTSIGTEGELERRHLQKMSLFHIADPHYRWSPGSEAQLCGRVMAREKLTMSPSSGSRAQRYKLFIRPAEFSLSLDTNETYLCTLSVHQLFDTDANLGRSPRRSLSLPHSHKASVARTASRSPHGRGLAPSLSPRSRKAEPLVFHDNDAPARNGSMSGGGGAAGGGGAGTGSSSFSGASNPSPPSSPPHGSGQSEDFASRSRISACFRFVVNGSRIMFDASDKELQTLGLHPGATNHTPGCMFEVEANRRSELYLVLEVDRPWYGDEKVDGLYAKIAAEGKDGGKAQKLAEFLRSSKPSAYCTRLAWSAVPLDRKVRTVTSDEPMETLETLEFTHFFLRTSNEINLRLAKRSDGPLFVSPRGVPSPKTIAGNAQVQAVKIAQSNWQEPLPASVAASLAAMTSSLDASSASSSASPGLTDISLLHSLSSSLLPRVDYVNALYVDLRSVVLNARVFSGTKSRMIGFKVQLLKKSGDAKSKVKAISTRQTGQGVLFDTFFTPFFEYIPGREVHVACEVKLELPIILTDTHALEITVMTMKRGKSSPKSIGKVRMPLWSGGRIPVEPHMNLIISELGDSVEGTKGRLQIQTNLISSIHTSEAAVADLFHCAVEDGVSHSTVHNTVLQMQNLPSHVSLLHFPLLFALLIGVPCKEASSPKYVPAIHSQLCYESCVSLFHVIHSAVKQAGEEEADTRPQVLEWFRSVILHNAHFAIMPMARKKTASIRESPLQPFVMLMRMMRCVFSEAQVLSIEIHRANSYSWFLFDVLIKLLMFYVKELDDISDAPVVDRTTLLPGPINTCILQFISSTAACCHRHILASSLQPIARLNRSLALFVKDLLSVIDRGVWLSAISSYSSRMSCDTQELAGGDGLAPSTLEDIAQARLEFFTIVFDSPFLIQLQAPFLEKDRFPSSPIFKCLCAEVLQMIACGSAKTGGDAIDMLYGLIMRALTDKSSIAQCHSDTRVADLLFEPLVEILCMQGSTSSWPSLEHRVSRLSRLACQRFFLIITFVLERCSPEFLFCWVQRSPSAHIVGLVRLCGAASSAFPDLECPTDEVRDKPELARATSIQFVRLVRKITTTVGENELEHYLGSLSLSSERSPEEELQRMSLLITKVHRALLRPVFVLLCAKEGDLNSSHGVMEAIGELFQHILCRPNTREFLCDGFAFLRHCAFVFFAPLRKNRKGIKSLRSSLLHLAFYRAVYHHTHASADSHFVRSHAVALLYTLMKCHHPQSASLSEGYVDVISSIHELVSEGLIDRLDAIQAAADDVRQYFDSLEPFRPIMPRVRHGLVRSTALARSASPRRNETNAEAEPGELETEQEVWEMPNHDSFRRALEQILLKAVVVARQRLLVQHMDNHILLPRTLVDIAQSYRDTPELRIQWLQHLRRVHEREGRKVEAAVTCLHIAALIGAHVEAHRSYLRSTAIATATATAAVPAASAAPAASFLSMCNGGTQASAEAALSLHLIHALFPDTAEERVMCDGGDLSSVAESVLSEESYVANVREGIALFSEASYHHASASLWKVLEVFYETAGDLDQCIVALKSRAQSLELLRERSDAPCRYMRVGYYGREFRRWELDGTEWIYRFEPSQSVLEVARGLCARWEEHLKCKPSLLDCSVNERLLDPERCSIRVSEVVPHDAREEGGGGGVYAERQQRSPALDHLGQPHRATRLDEEIGVTRFKRESRSGGYELHQQCIRTTSFVVAAPFPSLLPQIPVTHRAEEVYAPVEKAIKQLEERAALMAKRAADADAAADVNEVERMLALFLFHPSAAGGVLRVAEVFFGNFQFHQEFFDRLVAAFDHYVQHAQNLLECYDALLQCKGRRTNVYWQCCASVVEIQMTLKAYVHAARSMMPYSSATTARIMM